jgi:hypothetical protein
MRGRVVFSGYQGLRVRLTYVARLAWQFRFGGGLRLALRRLSHLFSLTQGLRPGLIYAAPSGLVHARTYTTHGSGLSFRLWVRLRSRALRDHLDEMLLLVLCVSA